MPLRCLFNNQEESKILYEPFQIIGRLSGVYLQFRRRNWLSKVSAVEGMTHCQSLPRIE